MSRDFPDGSVVKNPPSSAVDIVLIPGQGTKIQLAWEVGETKLMCCNHRAHVLWSLSTATREKPKHYNKRARVLQLGCNTVRNKQINIIKQCIRKVQDFSPVLFPHFRFNFWK